LRKNQPYEVYNEIPFNICVGNVGDCYDRYKVRIEEMRESLNIMQYCLENMPKGLVMSNNKKVATNLRLEIKNSMESLIHHFKYYSEGFQVPAGKT
jgi:NADH-quinone oxidoreductase subunit D